LRLVTNKLLFMLLAVCLLALDAWAM